MFFSACGFCFNLESHDRSNWYYARSGVPTSATLRKLIRFFSRKQCFTDFWSACRVSLVTSILLCACESWTLTAELQRRIQAMEMRCYRKIQRISYKNHVTNEEVRAKIQQAIGPHEYLLTIVKRRKLQRYGHVSRSPGVAKTILQGTEKGGRRQRTQRKRWEDNLSLIHI